MKEETKRSIEASLVFVHLATSEEEFSNSEGEEMLLYAIHLKKPLIVWIPPSREGERVVPGMLRESGVSFREVRGTHRDCYDAIRDIVGDGDINLLEGGYDGQDKVSSH